MDLTTNADRYNGTASPETISGWGGADSIAGNDGDDTIYGALPGGAADAGNLLLGGKGWDSLIGGDGNDTLFGGRNPDTLDGGAGNDFLSGDHGETASYGRDGDDVFFYEARTVSFEIDLDPYGNTIEDFNRNDDCDVIALLGYVPGSEELTLNNLRGTFYQQLTAVRIEDGAERLVVNVEGVGRVCEILAAVAHVESRAEAMAFLVRPYEFPDDPFTSCPFWQDVPSEDIPPPEEYRCGSDNAQPAAAILAGEALTDGDDRHNGTADGDIIEGLAGSDTIAGNGGSDVIYGGSASGGDDAGDLLLGNRGFDNLYGGEGSDTLYGGRDRDFLYGGEGNDFLAGDRGYDEASGGAGADVFYFNAKTAGPDASLEVGDTIDDFSLSDGDVIALHNYREGSLSFFEETVRNTDYIAVRATEELTGRQETVVFVDTFRFGGTAAELLDAVVFVDSKADALALL